MYVFALLLVGCADKTTSTEPTTSHDSGGDTGPADSGAGDGPVWATPCTSWAEPVQTGAIVDETLDETSGIVVSRRDPEVLWVHEDHLGAAAVTALSPAGDTLATVTLAGVTNNDWEDLAIGPCGDDWCIFIGEVGNNDLDRTEMGVYVLVEPDLSTITDGAATVSDWAWYGMVYPEGTENVEALAVTAQGLPVLLSKHIEGGTSDVYRYPALEALTDVTVGLMGTLTTGDPSDAGGAAVTAADLWPDDSRLLVRTYGWIYEVDLSAGLESVGTAPVATLTGANEMHGEAVAYDPWRGGFWQVAEGLNTPLWYTGCAE